MQLTDFELGWLVGLLEGEGCFRFEARTPRVTYNTTDEDIMHKAVALVEKVIEGPCKVARKDMSKYNENAKEQFYLQLYGENARTIMRLVVPHMGWRRRRHIWQALNGYAGIKPDKRMLEIIDNIVQLHGVA